VRLLGIIIGLVILSGVIIITFEQAGSDIKLTARMADLDLIREASRSFDPVSPGKPLIFPDDLGDHPQQQTDGWFYSGYLTDEAGQQYGVQLSFVRFGLSRGVARGDSEWNTNQIYFANFGLTDVTGQTFSYDQRFSRGNDRLAGADSAPYRVWVENWHASEVSPGKVQLKANNIDIALDLILEQTKPVVGLDNPNQEQAVTYYVLPDNYAQGVITTPRGAFTVTGHIWQYHMWGNLNFGPVAGWDLFWLQLDDNREIIFFDVRREENPLTDSTEEILLFDQVLLVEADGQAQFLPPEAVAASTVRYWKSPESKVEYPVEQYLSLPDQELDLHLKPLLDEQEFSRYFTYWKGIVSVEGSQRGYGYVELTGRGNPQVWTRDND
jgi:predicted secreted hydrolase